mgnify:CR=1 FL=1
MRLPKVRGLYRGFGGYFEGAGLLNDPTKILDYSDEMLVIGEGCRGGIQSVLMRTFILENLGGIDDFAKIFGRRIGELKMRTLYSELKDLLEEVENHE